MCCVAVILIFLVVTARYLVVIACYWWLLLVTARYCSFPLLVWTQNIWFLNCDPFALFFSRFWKHNEQKYDETCEITYSTKDAASSNCVKSVSIRRFSGPYFSAFGLNSERYSPFRKMEKMTQIKMMPKLVHFRKVSKMQ